MAAVEVMVNNARVADLIRENRTDELSDAIDEGEFFHMQSFSRALIDLVVAGKVDQEVAANGATNRHDFLIALEHALKKQAVESGDAAVAEQSGRAAPSPGTDLGIPALRVAAQER